jgi:hypothetical protein
LFSVCTNNKDGRLFVNAGITKNNTISLSWKYKLESCDERFVVYWSSKGLITKSAQHQKFIIDKNISFFEIKALGNVILHCKVPSIMSIVTFA